MPTPTLMIIIASTRPGRVALPVARWFERRASTHGGFAIDLVDLAALNLPFMDEPNHPLCWLLASSELFHCPDEASSQHRAI